MPTTRPVSGLQHHLGYWLRTVSNAVSHSFARKMEGEGATVAEWVLLRVLYDSDWVAPSRLAEHLRMTKGAISRLADRLLDKRLVQREANPDDRRAQKLALTPAGRRLVPRLASIADANDAAFFGALTRDEQRRLEQLLRKLALAHAVTKVPID